ncbi:MAG: sugar ABC transporter permease [Verrucomicrobia bacterium]|nr:sugar ABC transporter permease [Verrucomicrobiota bacterium]MBV9672517.1 sugar ABC transporter permease [Verrucomicrobiota bacterium]
MRPAFRSKFRNLLFGLLFISPWLIGFLLFLVYPVLSNFHLGMTDYSGFGDPRWIGWANYEELFHDTLFWKSLYNTLYYVALAVPLGVAVAIALALAMHQRLREVNLYRALLYIPSVAPAFALSMMLIWMLNPRYGLFNYLLSFLHIPAIDWLGDARWSKLAIVLVAQFGAGQFGLIFLAALRSIPSRLYDAASLDGAGRLRQFWHITLPLLTPTILYDLIIGLGLGLQVFVPAYIMTGGGPLNSTMFTALYIYKNAFEYSRVGFAAAISGILFLINTAIAVMIFWSSKYWVNYHLE